MLSGNQKTSIGGWSAYKARVGFAAKAAQVIDPCTAWSDVAANSNVFYELNTGATVWDAGVTNWDLIGNVYNTTWDGNDTWSNTTGNVVAFTKVSSDCHGNN